jgi:pilus assembly protein Flp/PilA
MLKKILGNRRGQGMVEYILIVVLIAAAIVGTMRIFGTQIKSMFSTASSTIQSEASKAGK